MFVKSQNQNAFIQYSHITGEKINANVYCVENDELIKIAQLHIVMAACRLAISDYAEYIVSAVYEKKFFIYYKSDDYRYKSFITDQYIDSVHVVENVIYVVFRGGSIGVYDLNGKKKEKKRMHYFPTDCYGEQYLVEDSYIKINKKRILPKTWTLFSSLLLVEQKYILCEGTGRLACYDSNGDLLWEYVSDVPMMRFDEIVYLACMHKLLLRTFIKKEEDSCRLVVIDIDQGIKVGEEKIKYSNNVFINGNSWMLDDEMNIVDVKEFITQK